MRVEMLIRRVVDGKVILSVEMYDTREDRMSSTVCNGCGVPFDKTHKLKNHRKSQHCGGIYLSSAEKAHQAALRIQETELQERLRSLRSAANYESYYPTGLSK